MGIIIRKIPWTRQPQAPSLDRSNPIGRFVTSAFAPRSISSGLVQGSKGHLLGSGQILGAGRFGPTWKYTSSPTGSAWSERPIGLKGGSVLFILTPDWLISGSTQEMVHLGDVTASNFLRLYFESAGGSADRFTGKYRGNGGSSVPIFGPVKTDAELKQRIVLCYTWKTEVGVNDGVTAFYENGVLVDSDSALDLRAMLEPSDLGMMVAFNGDVELIAFFSKALTEQEAVSVSNHPYQIFQPRTQYIPVGVADVVAGRIMSSLAYHGGLVGPGGIAGSSGGLAG